MGTQKKKKKKEGAVQAAPPSVAHAAKQGKLPAKLLKVTAKLQKPNLTSTKRQALQLKLDKILNHLSKQADATGVPLAPAVQPSIYSAVKAKPASTGQLRAGLLGTAAVQQQTPAELARRQQRNLRFHSSQPAASSPSRKETLRAARAAALADVYGQNASLEKEYLRLTSMPTLDAVRPPRVLRSALHMVQAKWLKEANYGYACEQLKSIRQDLTVQHIRDALTVYTYETHARIALEMADYAEFNQCQSMLKQLFAEGVPGNRMEFAAYGLLYTAAVGPAQLPLELRRLGGTLSHPYLQHALKVLVAYQQYDCAGFLALYAGAPRMMPYLMDTLLDKMRVKALAALIAAFLPTLPLSLVKTHLGFDSGYEAAEFASAQGAVVDGRLTCIDTKLSRSAVVGPLAPHRA